jgi:hypothetical protein
VLCNKATLDVTDKISFVKLYSVERAHKEAQKQAEGKFVVLIDCHGFQWAKAPPLKQVREAFRILQRHYPLCLGGLYVLNASPAIQTVWHMLSPMLTERTKKKVSFLSSQEAPSVLRTVIGADNLEVEFGGDLQFEWNPVTYFAKTKRSLWS